jgi:hypothetical protein
MFSVTKIFFQYKFLNQMYFSNNLSQPQYLRRTKPYQIFSSAGITISTIGILFKRFASDKNQNFQIQQQIRSKTQIKSFEVPKSGIRKKGIHIFKRLM